MNRKLISTLFLTVVMAVVMMSASAAKADLLLTIDAPTPGALDHTLNYTGTLTATTDLGIDGDFCTVSGAITCDDSPFLTNAPLTMTAGQSLNFLLFTLILDPNLPYGSYNGSFIIAWTDVSGAPGITDPGQDGNFSAAVPEPASLLLLGSGLVGVIRRKRQK
jgi:hypothetical protein